MHYFVAENGGYSRRIGVNTSTILDSRENALDWVAKIAKSRIDTWLTYQNTLPSALQATPEGLNSHSRWIASKFQLYECKSGGKLKRDRHFEADLMTRLHLS